MHVAVAKDAFRYDDGVVDQHADGEHQPHHRQHVQSETGEVQNTERNGQRERHRRCNNQSSRDLPKKQVKDKQRQ